MIGTFRRHVWRSSGHVVLQVKSANRDDEYCKRRATSQVPFTLLSRLPLQYKPSKVSLHVPPKSISTKVTLSKEQRRKRNSTLGLAELTDKEAAKYKSSATNGAVEKKPAKLHPRDVKRKLWLILSSRGTALTIRGPGEKKVKKQNGKKIRSTVVC